jgi:hypothetical protein
VRDLVYAEISEKLRCPLHVRSTEHGGEAVYNAGMPGRPVYVVKDSKDLFVRVNEDGSPYAFAPKGEPGPGGGLGGGPGGPPRPRKPRPSGGAGGGAGQSARDKERDATWEVRGAGGGLARGWRSGGLGTLLPARGRQRSPPTSRPTL